MSATDFAECLSHNGKIGSEQTSYVAHLGATISDVQISSPEKTEEPFALAYDYTLKDFAGGDKHRFAVPLSVGIPAVKDDDLKRNNASLSRLCGRNAI